MPSDNVPEIHCVHIFESEFQLLKCCFEESIGEKGLACFLYGLWTHTSNAVVHLVVCNKTEMDYAKQHNLDCVGYVANCYTKSLYNKVRGLTELTSTRQHIIVDVSETTRKKSLQAYGTHDNAVRASGEASSQGHLLQVNMLQGESPFRKEFFKAHPELKNTKEYKSESENVLHSDNLNGEKHIPIVDDVKFGNELRELNFESKRAKTTENSTESETAGHQSELKPDSSSIRLFQHKVKFEFQLDEVLSEKSSGKLSFYFQHNHKQWEIMLTQDPTNDETLAQIITDGNEHSSNPQVFHTQTVVNDIKELCQCETCNKIEETIV